MKIVAYGKRIDEPMVIALGFFDCLHSGHKKLIGAAAELAQKLGAKVCVFTFSNNPSAERGGKVVNTFIERAEMLNELGADFLLHAQFDNAFKSKSAQAFLNEIFSQGIVKGIVCGFDYRFGNNAEGDVELLKHFCNEREIVFFEQPEVVYNGQKVSTTRIKEYLLDGNMRDVNGCLGYNYFLEGYVNAGHGKGRELGFPTANVDVDSEKQLPKDGVYSGFAQTENGTFRCVANIGGRPTFGDGAGSVEAHLIGFSGDLYFQKVRICLERRLRPQKTFSSESELAFQIANDIKEAENE